MIRKIGITLLTAQGVLALLVFVSGLTSWQWFKLAVIAIMIIDLHRTANDHFRALNDQEAERWSMIAVAYTFLGVALALYR